MTKYALYLSCIFTALHTYTMNNNSADKSKKRSFAHANAPSIFEPNSEDSFYRPPFCIHQQEDIFEMPENPQETSLNAEIQAIINHPYWKPKSTQLTGNSDQNTTTSLKDTAHKKKKSRQE